MEYSRVRRKATPIEACLLFLAEFDISSRAALDFCFPCTTPCYQPECRGSSSNLRLEPPRSPAARHNPMVASRTDCSIIAAFACTE